MFEQYGEPSPWALEGWGIRDKQSSSVGVFELSLWVLFRVWQRVINSVPGEKQIEERALESELLEVLE